MKPTYESILCRIRALPTSADQNTRAVEWFDQTRAVGAAVGDRGTFELFVRGSALTAHSGRVRGALHHNSWNNLSGETFTANRLVFQNEPHFGPATAFVAEELYRNQVVTNAQVALHAVEPLIDLIVQRQTSSHEQALGLVGELWVLREIMSGATSEGRIMDLFDAWKGHSGSGRDFELDVGESLEVKATTALKSHHRLHGVAQGDPKRDGAGNALESLHLVSIGLAEVPTSQESFSCQSLIREICDLAFQHLARSKADAVSTLLVERVRGAMTDKSALEDDGTAKDPRLLKVWHLSFVRIYDMADSAVLTLRRGQLLSAGYVRPATIHYDLDLPDTLRYANPVPDPRGWLRSRS